MTTFSPWTVGSIDTRTSTSFLSAFTLKRPSCGRRRSAMSRFERIFMREHTALCSAFGGAGRSTSSPSMRYLRREVFSKASKWMSDALVFNASTMMVFTMRITGASPAASIEASSASSAPCSLAPISMSPSSPFMMVSIARAGLAESSACFMRCMTSASSEAGMTTDHTRPLLQRATSSCAGRSNGSANATVSRPQTFARGTALTRFHASYFMPHITSADGMNPGGSEIGWMFR